MTYCAILGRNLYSLTFLLFTLWSSLIFLSLSLEIPPNYWLQPLTWLVLLLVTASSLKHSVKKAWQGNYSGIALILGATAIGLTRIAVDVCQIDDGYHCDKVILFLKSWSVTDLVQGKNVRSQFVLSGTEAIWAALFYPVGNHFFVKISQFFPIYLLFAVLSFCREQSNAKNLHLFDWCLLAMILSIQHVWGSFFSGYVDSFSAMFFVSGLAITYEYLIRQNRALPWQVGTFLALVATLQLTTKATNFTWGFVFYLLALIAILKVSDRKSQISAFFLSLFSLASATIFVFLHMMNAYKHSRNPLFPAELPVLKKLAQLFPDWISPPIEGLEGELAYDIFRHWEPVWNAHWLYSYTDSERVRILMNWMLDYKFRVPTADPFVGAYGPIWTWVLAPLFMLSLAYGVFHFPKFFKKGNWISIGVTSLICICLFVNYFFLFGAFYQRLMMGPNLALLTIALFFYFETIHDRISVQKGKLLIPSLLMAFGFIQFTYNYRTIYQYSENRTFPFLWNFYSDRPTKENLLILSDQPNSGASVAE